MVFCVKKGVADAGVQSLLTARWNRSFKRIPVIKNIVQDTERIDVGHLKF